MPFLFTDQDIVAGSDAYVARLPAKVASKEALLQALDEHLRFPDYFGFNWDALSECLRDFHWLESRTVVLVHADLPRLSLDECRTYVGILSFAVTSWQPGEEHELRVIFPTDVRAEVIRLLVIDEFFQRDATSAVRSMLQSALQACSAATEPLIRRLELDRFEVTLDAATRSVLVEDVLDPSDDGMARLTFDELADVLVGSSSNDA